MKRSLVVRWLVSSFLIVMAVPALAAGYTATLSGNWSAPATWGGAGVPGPLDGVTVGTGMVVTVDAPATVRSITMIGGEITGPAALSVTAYFTFYGGTLSGTGTLSILNGAQVDILENGIIDGRTLSNAGTIRFVNPPSICPYGKAFASGTLCIWFLTYVPPGNLSLQNGAVLTNSGVIDFRNDGSLLLGGGTASLIDSGAIVKTSGNRSLLAVPLTIENGGRVDIQNGAISFGDIASHGGRINIAYGTTAFLASTTTATFDEASTITGGGTLECAAGTAAVAGTISVAAVRIKGGTLSINSATPQSIPTLDLKGGTLNGTGALSVNSSDSGWSGTLGGTGTLSLQLHLSIGNVVVDAKPIDSHDAISINGTNSLSLQNGASLTNYGQIYLGDTAGIYLNTGSAAMTNYGTIRRNLGKSTTTITVPTTNAPSGVIQPEIGTLAFSSLTNSGTLSFPVYFPFEGGALFGKIAINGAFSFDGTLTATMTGDYAPLYGTNFEVMTFTSSSGAFQTRSLAYPGGTFIDSYSATALTLTTGNGSCYQLPSGAISWYRAEGNGADTVGTNIARTGIAGFDTGYIGRSLYLNRPGVFGSAPDSPTLRPLGITAEAWIKFSSIPTSPTAIVSKTYGSGSLDSYAVSYDGAGFLRGEITDGSGRMVVSTPWAPAAGTWYHVAFSFDDDTHQEKLYVNGAAAASATYAGVRIVYDTHPLMIGAAVEFGGNASFFPGWIDELTLYDHALSPQQIQNIYLAGTVGKCLSMASPTIASFTPNSGTTGAKVFIAGTNFIGVANVVFGQYTFSEFTVDSPTQITATVPGLGPSSMPISVVSPGGSATSSEPFTWLCPVAEAEITAPASVCAGEWHDASVPAEYDTTHYVWQITNGTIVSGAGTRRVSFIAKTPGTTVVISVTVTNGACSKTGTRDVISKPQVSALISIPSTVICGGMTGNASVPLQTGASYGWSITNGSIVAGYGTNAIQFVAGKSGELRLNVNVYVDGSCPGLGGVVNTITPAPDTTMTAPPSVSPGTTGQASVASQSGATYLWTISNGSITSGNGTNTITFTAGSSGHLSIGVTVTAGSCPASQTKNIPIIAIAPLFDPRVLLALVIVLAGIAMFALRSP